MKVHEQRDTLVEAIKLALWALPSGPTLSAFGIAREDCAIAHIDYFGAVDGVGGILNRALAEVEGIETHESWAKYGHPDRPCDCRSCVGPEAAAKAREKHRAAYTNVKEWKVPDA